MNNRFKSATTDVQIAGHAPAATVGVDVGATTVDEPAVTVTVTTLAGGVVEVVPTTGMTIFCLLVC